MGLKGIGQGVGHLVHHASAAQGVRDTHQVVKTGVQRAASFWSDPPSNDNGLWNYFFVLRVTDEGQLKAQIPGFNPQTAKPFSWAPDAHDGKWKPFPMGTLSPSGDGSHTLSSAGQHHTPDLALDRLKQSGVAFGIDVPNASGGVDRYWFQGPGQNAHLDIMD